MDAGPEDDPSTPWLGRLGCVLRLLFAGVAGLAAVLHPAEERAGRAAGRDVTLGVCFVLGAASLLALQALWDLLLCALQQQHYHKAPVDGPDIAECRLRLKAGAAHECWMHEYLLEGSPSGPHRLRPVLVRLEDNVLSLWSGEVPAVPRKALWDTEHRLGKARAALAALADLGQAQRRDYPLQGGSVTLLPGDLTPAKRWSRKYPICVTVSGEPRVAPASPLPPPPAPVSSSPSVSVTPTASTQQPGGEESPKESTAKDVKDLQVDDLLDDLDAVKNVEDAEDHLLGKIVSAELGLLPDEEDEAHDEDGVADAAGTLLLFARTARQKEEWFWMLSRSVGEPHPLDDPGLLEDYLSALRPYLEGGPGGPGGPAEDGAQPYAGINALAGRVLFDASRSAHWSQLLQKHLQRRINAVSIPTYVETPVVSDVHFRPTCVSVSRAGAPRLREDGLWVDLDVSYRGVVRFVITTKLVLGTGERAERVPESPEAAEGEQHAAPETSGPPPSSFGTKIFKRLAESRLFQSALAALSGTDLVLAVELRSVEGVLAVNVPPPPSDCLWFGFRGRPGVKVVVEPRLGSRTVRQAIVCRLIEARIRAQLDRVVVLPNMQNVILPFAAQPAQPAQPAQH